MSSRSKEKVAAAFRKFFKSPEKKTKENGENGGQQGSSNKNGGSTTDSPGRRLRRATISPNNAVPPSQKPGNAQDSKAKPLEIRARRLMKELKEIQKSQHSKADPIFTVELLNDNLFEWHCKIFRIDPDSPLALDLVELNIPHISLHISFPQTFPFSPPFVRVVEPKIEKGFVMEGGAICIELLTPKGWASAYTVEAIIMQFTASLVKGQGRICRKQKSNKDYSKRSAEEAFRSLVKTHEKYGWVSPPLSDG